MKQPAFSFVMPAYKAEYLSKAIDSILNQSYRNFELIIVNDASPENLERIIAGFEDERIHYQENTHNIGGKDLVKNWNHCISLAKNDYIILATDDDMFEADYLADAAKLIEKHPEVNIIRSGVKKIDEHENIIDFEFPTKEYLTYQEFALFYAKGGTISCVSNYIFKREALIKAGGFISFPRAHYSDDATALALSKKGVGMIAANNFNFRVSNINLSNRNDLKIVKEQLRATTLYMEWYLNHIKEINVTSDNYLERACYGGYKSRYIAMNEKLLSKIPFSKLFFVIHHIFSNKYLFRKEKYRLLFAFIINQL